jgi:hypothetical protein
MQTDKEWGDVDAGVVSAEALCVEGRKEGNRQIERKDMM